MSDADTKFYVTLAAESPNNWIVIKYNREETSANKDSDNNNNSTMDNNKTWQHWSLISDCNTMAVDIERAPGSLCKVQQLH